MSLHTPKSHILPCYRDENSPRKIGPGPDNGPQLGDFPDTCSPEHATEAEGTQFPVRNSKEYGNNIPTGFWQKFHVEKKQIHTQRMKK